MVTLPVSLGVVLGVNQYFGRLEKPFVCEMTALPGLQLDLRGLSFMAKKPPTKFAQAHLKARRAACGV